MKKSKKIKDDDESDLEIESLSNNNWRTFNDVPPECHKQVCFKVLKFWLKSYYKLNAGAFPQSSVLRQEELINGAVDVGDSFALKMDIDNAIEALPLGLKKIIYLNYILDLPVNKTCLILGLKFRVDAYRRLDECFEKLYESLGSNWLQS